MLVCPCPPKGRTASASSFSLGTSSRLVQDPRSSRSGTAHRVRVAVTGPGSDGGWGLNSARQGSPQPSVPPPPAYLPGPWNLDETCWQGLSQWLAQPPEPRLLTPCTREDTGRGWGTRGQGHTAAGPRAKSRTQTCLATTRPLAEARNPRWGGEIPWPGSTVGPNARGQRSAQPVRQSRWGWPPCCACFSRVPF